MIFDTPDRLAQLLEKQGLSPNPVVKDMKQIFVSLTNLRLAPRIVPVSEHRQRKSGPARDTGTCDLGATHAGPFYTVTALAALLGEGTRRKDQKRGVSRKVLGHLCLDCANRLEFRVGTAEFRAFGDELMKFEESDDVHA